MATEVGSAFVSILPSAKGFGANLGKVVDGESGKAGTRGGRVFGGTFAKATAGPFKSVIGMVGGPLAAGFAAIAGIKVFSGFIADARESAKVGAITASVIKSTGGAAGLTAGQIGNLATAISNKTGIDDEQIQANQNVLLTFTKVRNEVGKGNAVFSRASMLAQDMATVLGTDASGASIQLGKALNDPIKGITALSRAGVSFTEQQKNQIKTLVKNGDTLGAQKIILREVTKEFGGAAAAAATPMDKLKVTVGNLGEQVGAKLIPFLDKGALGVSAFVTALQGGAASGSGFVGFMSRMGVVVRDQVIPAIQQFGAFLQAEVMPRLQALGVFIAGTVVPALASLAGFVKRNSDFFVPFAGTILAIVAALRIWAAVQTVLNVVLAANPVGLVVIAIAGLVAMFVLAYKRSETFRAIVQGAFAGIKAAAQAVMTFFTSTIPATWNTIVGATRSAWSAVSGAISGAWNAIKGAVTGAVNAVIGFITGHWKTILAILGGPFAAAVVLIATHWSQITGAVSNGISTVVGFIRAMPGKILGALGNLGNLLLGAGRSIIQGLLDGLQAGFDLVKTKLSQLTNLIPDWKGPRARDKKLLTPAGKAIMQSLIAGVDDHLPKVKEALSKVTATIRDKLSGKAEAGALGAIKKQSSGLIAAAKGLDVANDRLSRSKDRLGELVKESADFSAGLRDSLRGAAAITNAAQGATEDNPLTVGGIQAFLASQLSAIQTFAADMASLTARGLSKSTLGQLAGGGLGDGAAAAHLLAGATASELASINAMQSQIDTLTQGIGDRTALTLFGEGIDRAQKTYDEQLVQQKRAADELEALAAKLARVLGLALDAQARATATALKNKRKR